jgi:hypothetical protein
MRLLRSASARAAQRGLRRPLPPFTRPLRNILADARRCPGLGLNNLAGTLQLLGERESGTARIEEALAAFREAVKGYTRIRTPSATPEQLRDRVRAALLQRSGDLAILGCLVRLAGGLMALRSLTR